MSHTLDIMVPHLHFLCILIANPIPNLETHQIVKERKCAYVFGDGVAWEILDKNIVWCFSFSFSFFKIKGECKKRLKNL
jgi:hypothetical protein